MAAGGRRTFLRMQKQPLRDPPNAICAGLVRVEKAMRGRIAFRKHCPWPKLCAIVALFAEAFGVRARPPQPL